MIASQYTFIGPRKTTSAHVARPNTAQSAISRSWKPNPITVTAVNKRLLR